jgi:chitinase
MMMLFRSVGFVAVAAFLSAGVCRAAGTTRPLPSGALNMAYTEKCEISKITEAVENGVNVIFWFSIDLVADADGRPAVVPSAVQPLPDLSCIATVASTLLAKGLPTTHLVSVGGWGAPLPVTAFSAEEMWAAWKDWNANEVEAAGLIGGFDGIDWDMEGANDQSAPSNTLNVAMMDLVGQVSQLAKQDGYIVSMVPPESYLDSSTPQFDSSLLHTYPEYVAVGNNFSYHGHNGYAYLLAKYGQTTLSPTSASSSYAVVDTYDLVSVQVYESYTHLLYNTTYGAQSAADYLVEWLPTLQNGWFVDFSSAPEFSLASQVVSVKKEALCVGVANGWANNRNNALVMPEQLQAAYETLQGVGMEPRGFVFWVIDDEGAVPQGQTQPLYMAAGINKFLHTRT